MNFCWNSLFHLLMSNEWLVWHTYIPLFTVVWDTWALKKIFDFLRSVSWIHSDLWNFPTCEFTEIFYLLLDPCWNKKISFIWHSKTDDEYFSFPFYARQTKQILHNWDLMIISRFQILFSLIVVYSLKASSVLFQMWNIISPNPILVQWHYSLADRKE